VGPRSAGAEPGPACYGRGGTEPTVTDACLVLGWLDPQYPLADSVRLDRAAAERALSTLPFSHDVCEIAAGIVQVATAVMARALKRVSLARGVDPRGMALLPFGGAGPLFACALADALGMSRVVIPPHAGALSALGLAAAAEQVELLASCHRPMSGLTRDDLAAAFAPAPLRRCGPSGSGREGPRRAPRDYGARPAPQGRRVAGRRARERGHDRGARHPRRRGCDRVARAGVARARAPLGRAARQT